MARKPAPRRGASKSNGSQRTVPGWVWLFTGVVTGLFIAFLFHLGQTQLERQADNAPRTATREPASPPKAEEKGPRFDFYAVLPQMEVIVPKGEDDAQAPARNTGRTSSPSADVPSRHNEHFLLQAGSFRRSQDADRRRAELILQGYEARVQPVSLESGDTWHRVMIGPFDNVNTLHRAQDKLATAGIETLPIQVKNPG